MKDALCASCGRFLISDLSEPEQAERAAARGAGRAIVAAIAMSILGFMGWVVLVECRSYDGAARVRAAQTDIDTIFPIAEKWVVDHPGDCPTMERLRAARELSAGSRLEDPWDNRYRIACSGDDVVVSSDGPDGRRGTVDDITVRAAERSP